MATDPFKMPRVTREKGERNLDLPLFMWRYVPPWNTPEWSNAEIWRKVVRNQPFCMLCRDALIDNFLALDWKIESKDANKRDELKSEIEYYTDFFTDNGDFDYVEHVEWIGQDYLDLPFGAAIEVGREGDDPQGRLIWIDLLDGATLFPTLNADLPIGQRLPELPLEPVFFPKHAINRLYMTPRPEIKRKGWGMAPPEKIYLALEMLSRSDRYWANLLLDTPPAGLLDLIDMEKETAEQWVESFRALMAGVDAFKIPVLYEHTTKAEFVPFGKPPTDLMFDNVTLKLNAIIASGYGMSIGDLGIPESQNGGNTMAGTIRQERATRRRGFALLKKKIINYFNRLLPDTLTYKVIDYDEETSEAIARARQGNATAFGTLIDKRVFTPKEVRLQMISDGDVNVPGLPEDVPEDEFPKELDPAYGKPTPDRPENLGYKKPASSGGYGAKSRTQGGFESAAAVDALEGVFKASFDTLVAEANDPRIRKLIRITARTVLPEVQTALQELSEAQDIERWNMAEDARIFNEPIVLRALDEPLEDEDWWELDVEEKSIIAALTLAYMESLKSSAQELVEELYEEGYLSAPTLPENVVFALENEFVKSYLDQRSTMMVRNINDGTKYYLQRILLSSVRRGLTEPEIIARIREGIDIDEILHDNVFMQKLSQSVKSEISAMTDERIRAIVSYELRSVENQARLDQFKRVGLTRKAWKHYGPDEPCELCIENEGAGYVPMSHAYRGTFGEIQTPPAHPHEHCSVMYDRSELAAIQLRGKFNIWSGN